MSNHTPVAPATNQNQPNETPVYHSLANYAKDCIYLVEELQQANSALSLLSETSHDHYEEQMGNAQYLIYKVQAGLHQQLKEKLQTLRTKPQACKPREYTKYREVRVSRVQEAQERPMYPDIQQDILNRLTVDYSFTGNGDWLQQGICPACNKKELFTSIEQPWVVRCGRENKCGWEGHTKELYPDAFANFNQRFVASQESPNATADAYLKYARGFDLARIKGWYRQGKFWHPKANKGTATVRFDIDRAHVIFTWSASSKRC